MAIRSTVAITRPVLMLCIRRELKLLFNCKEVSSVFQAFSGHCVVKNFHVFSVNVITK